MKLILTMGYPYPYPANASQAEQERISEAAGNNCLILNEVIHFEWKHTVTVEFANCWTAGAAKEKTGWRFWDKTGLILEAGNSMDDGYDHPAITTKDTAYCGFMLVE